MDNMILSTKDMVLVPTVIDDTNFSDDTGIKISFQYPTAE